MDMEEMAKKLRREVDIICAGYHFYRQEDAVGAALKFAEEIKVFCGHFLQGNVFGMEEDDYVNLLRFAAGVLKDYLEAAGEHDNVLMVDTLDYGLRELLDIYPDSVGEEGVAHHGE